MAEDNSGSLTFGIPDAIAKAQTGKVGYLQVSNIQSQQGTGKYTFELSDGHKKIKCIVGSAHSQEIRNNAITNGTVIQVFKYVPTAIAGKQTAIITKMEVIQKECEILLENDNKPLVTLNPPAVKGGSSAFGQSSLSKPAFGGSNNNSRTSGSGGQYMPIASLSPYMSSNWKIKARVVEKSDIRTWEKASGSGKLFSFTLQDESGKQIKVTAFNDEVDKFFTTIIEDKVYIISKGRVKADNYKSRVDNDYAMTLQRDSSIEVAVEVDNSFAARTFDFVSIADLEKQDEMTYVDICAVVQSVSEMQEFTSKAGKDLRKRNIVLVDESEVSVECTIWSAMADKYSPETLPINTIVVLPGCRVSHFSGRSLSANSILLDQNNEKTELLQNWITKGGPSGAVKTISVRGQRSSDLKLTWAEADQQNMGRNPTNKDDYKGDYFDITGTIVGIPHNMEKPPYYKSCPEGSDSNSKVEEDGNGKWHSAKIDKTFDTYTPRWTTRMEVQDHTGSKYCATFNDMAEQILSCKASQVEQYEKAQDEENFNQVFRQALWQKKRFTVRATTDTWNDEDRVRFTICRVVPFNYVEEANELLQKLQAM